MGYASLHPSYHYLQALAHTYSDGFRCGFTHPNRSCLPQSADINAGGGAGYFEDVGLTDCALVKLGRAGGADR